MANIIVKNYEHFNTALGNWDSPKGKYISSRAHYERELAKQGMIPFEQAEQMKVDTHKPYDGISKKAMDVCNAAKGMADKRGNLKVGTRLQKGMESVGVSFDLSRLPKHYMEETKGGIYNE